jgi:uncharacterized protein (TIGR02118 family)
MASFFALYPEPEDVEGFEEHYREVHLPLMDEVEGVTEMRTTRATGTPRGGDAPYHLVFEAVFESDEALQAALAGEAFREAGRDAAGMAERFGMRPVMLLGEGF